VSLGNTTASALTVWALSSSFNGQFLSPVPNPNGPIRIKQITGLLTCSSVLWKCFWTSIDSTAIARAMADTTPNAISGASHTGVATLRDATACCLAVCLNHPAGGEVRSSAVRLKTATSAETASAATGSSEYANIAKLMERCSDGVGDQGAEDVL
jgi:hypothetical protein